MKIRITQYTREDGVVLLEADPLGMWIIRSIHGPSWFWYPYKHEWIISTGIEWKKLVKKCRVSEKKGLELLETVPKKT